MKLLNSPNRNINSLLNNSRGINFNTNCIEFKDRPNAQAKIRKNLQVDTYLERYNNIYRNSNSLSEIGPVKQTRRQALYDIGTYPKDVAIHILNSYPLFSYTNTITNSTYFTAPRGTLYSPVITACTRKDSRAWAHGSTVGQPDMIPVSYQVYKETESTSSSRVINYNTGMLDIPLLGALVGGGAGLLFHCPDIHTNGYLNNGVKVRQIEGVYSALGGIKQFPTTRVPYIQSVLDKGGN